MLMMEATAIINDQYVECFLGHPAPELHCYVLLVLLQPSSYDTNKIFNICGTIKTTCQLRPAENIRQDVFCIK